ncbi:4-hydroxy-tetrahydrodipicolinate synthase [Lichenihabitans psoromatis]|uniref:4-hydroxy-tetrahydrodipicolinate synthase n=1 Tax=Lichenihabitans psoromatis TaxID=2528642 RepID=UPI001036B80E|nr:4-hydroxy-tetrahydrodipicolinate synthase [Lichenihabitans psoromatis]
MTLLKGSIVDLVTPFAGEGIAECEVAELVEWQISQGTNGIAICTTTGEGPTLTTGEMERLIRICVEVSATRVPIIAATGTYGTESTIALTQMAKAAGAAAALVVTPYYSRPSQEGLYRHFEAVARAVDLPIVLHNVPSRTGVDLLPTTVGRLVQIPSTVGIFDQGTDPLKPFAIEWATNRRLFQRWDSDVRAFAFARAKGQVCISALANLVPAACAMLRQATFDQRHDVAADIIRRLTGLLEALACDGDPAQIKVAMKKVRPGFPTSCRLPIVGGSAEYHDGLGDELKALLIDPFWNPHAPDLRRPHVGRQQQLLASR